MQFGQGNVPELRAAHAEVAETERKATVRVKLGEKPCALGVGREEFDDGLEVDNVLALVHRSALRAAVFEEFFCLCFRDECHLVGSLCKRTPAVRSRQSPDRWGPLGNRTTVIRKRQTKAAGRAAPTVTAARRWRGGCQS
jgi:hypothetical protein